MDNPTTFQIESIIPSDLTKKKCNYDRKSR